MIITILFGTEKSAIADLYKNLINSFKGKKDIICIYPKGYKGEYNENFILKEDDFTEKSMIERIYKLFVYLFSIKKIANKQKNKNALIFHEGDFLSIFSAIFLKLIGFNINVWVHDPIAHLGESKKNKFIRWIAFHTYIKKAKNIIVSYEKAKKILIKEYKISLEKIKVINLPQMQEMEFEDIRNDVNIELKYDFIFYGRIEEYKGLDLLLEVFKDKNLKNIKLLIVGRGKKDKEIKEKITNFKNITFINEYVPNRDLAKYIMKSKFVILPYKTATGTQTIQIANYYNRMVLATKVGCFIEYINEGKNGLFIDKQEYNSLKKSILEILEYKMDSKQKLLINEEYKKYDLIKTANKLYNIIDSQ